MNGRYKLPSTISPEVTNLLARMLEPDPRLRASGAELWSMIDSLKEQNLKP